MISIIIPVYNEEKTIRKLLNSFSYDDYLQLIVVDGRSEDKTRELSRAHPVEVIEGIRNRALQMNAGAAAAKGDKLLFLHADSLIEAGSLEEIDNRLSNGYVGGCLSQAIDSNRIIYRFIEASGNIRARLFKVFYGDQAIFVRKDIFLKLNGFDNVDLFEDIIFSKKLKNEGKTVILNKKVYTSSRRWEIQGVVRATLINWLLTFGFFLGISPNTLKKIYSDIR